MAVADAPNFADEYLPAEETTRVERKVDHIVTAVFGNPLDTDDHGMIGEMRETRKMVTEKLDRMTEIASHLLIGVLGLSGVLLVVGVTIALAVH